MNCSSVILCIFLNKYLYSNSIFFDILHFDKKKTKKNIFFILHLSLLCFFFVCFFLEKSSWVTCVIDYTKSLKGWNVVKILAPKCRNWKEILLIFFTVIGQREQCLFFWSQKFEGCYWLKYQRKEAGDMGLVYHWPGYKYGSSLSVGAKIFGGKLSGLGCCI